MSLSRLEGRRSEKKHGAVQSPLKRNSSKKIVDLREKLSRCNRSTDEQVLRVEKRPSSRETEKDPVILERRSKEIQYGKNTQDYMEYRRRVPKESRMPSMPQTPNKYLKLSRRRWDGIVKSWKLNIHREVGAFPIEEIKTDLSEISEIKMEDWAHQVDLEESLRNESRASSSSFSDVGFSSCGVVTPRTNSGCHSPESNNSRQIKDETSDDESYNTQQIKTEQIKDETSDDSTPIDYIDY